MGRGGIIVDIAHGRLTVGSKLDILARDDPKKIIVVVIPLAG